MAIQIRIRSDIRIAIHVARIAIRVVGFIRVIRLIRIIVRLLNFPIYGSYLAIGTDINHLILVRPFNEYIPVMLRCFRRGNGIAFLGISFNDDFIRNAIYKRHLIVLYRYNDFLVLSRNDYIGLNIRQSILIQP